MKKNDQLGDKSLVKERILYKKQSAMEDHAKKICGTCMRKISPNNIHFVINDLMRDGKIWCGACKINKNYISYPNQAPSSPPWTT